MYIRGKTGNLILTSNMKYILNSKLIIMLIFALIITRCSGADEKLNQISINNKLNLTSPSSTLSPLNLNSNETLIDKPNKTINDLEIFLLDVANETLNAKDSYQILSGVNLIPNSKNTTKSVKKHKKNRRIDEKLADKVKDFAETHVLNVNLPRAVETGRLFFFKGLKKLMWPIIIGVQIAKTILLALFLPSILGSFGKILGKGISGFSGLSNHPEPVEDLDFKNNGYNGEEDLTFDNANAEYSYGDDATNTLATQMYDSAASNNALSRYGPGGQKITYINSPNHNHYSKGTNTLMSSKKDDFKIFHEIPASSLLLTNYDPFYSPLLSRLDAVFQPLGYGNGNEKCREKLVCLMYANPAKYAPYSNLISAQLSRELNQLKRPTTDNPDILRFFKYMKAAKDGQDGVDCESGFPECTQLRDSSNPVMLNTYNDINKLVQARKQ